MSIPVGQVMTQAPQSIQSPHSWADAMVALKEVGWVGAAEVAGAAVFEEVAEVAGGAGGGVALRCAARPRGSPRLRS